MSENQTSLEKKLNALTEKFNTQQSPNNSGLNYQTNNQNQRSRGNYRGRYNNRGNNYRGNSRGRYGNNSRGNNRGRYNYRGNSRGQNSSYYNSNYNNYNNYNNDSFRQIESNDETTVNTGIYDRHIETTAMSQKVCYNCGYPNHTARNCEVKGRNSSRGGQIPSNSQPKNASSHTHQPVHLISKTQIFMTLIFILYILQMKFQFLILNLFSQIH